MIAVLRIRPTRVVRMLCPNAYIGQIFRQKPEICICGKKVVESVTVCIAWTKGVPLSDGHSSLRWRLNIETHYRIGAGTIRLPSRGKRLSCKRVQYPLDFVR